MQTKTLFSPYYLDTRLAGHPEWAEDPGPVFATIQALWQKASQYGPAWNEAQTEEELVKPALAALGWSFIVQAKSSKKGQVTRPDYALFADETDRDAAYPHQGHDDAFYSRALAIGEAKYWGRPLSQKESSGRDTWKAGANPSHQMVSYLVGTRVAWGILTNGQVWRLYSREVSSTASEFYEIDLNAIFSAPPAEALEQFKRFWLFFRRGAFTPGAHGKSFVQRVHEGSATYARQISDKLKELVFDEVMPEIAGGFVAYRYQQLGQQAESEESLRQIYQASLSLLYKLLFLLYAEARNLLPLANPGYRQKSLTELARWAAEQIDRGLPLSTATHATDKYDALLALFRRIDQGDPSLGIPRYNGGLFNPAAPENQFLSRHKLSDRAVARAVDILVRDAGQPVDYAYISVRNLGAIYEGLLENRLRVVDAAGGKVELINDKGERKASGSYYTPDYIVEYIVQHTLEPILAERDVQFQAAMDRCAGLRRQLAHTADAAANHLRRRQLEQAERDAREAFLGIKALDPAMGSGHFLVNAVDHLTDGIIQRMQTYHDARPGVPWEWNPIQQLIERVRQDILAEMARQGIGVDPARLDDTALLTRLVMKRCIYGVDLNPMTVELAKLSLWLHSFTVGAPLSFLDHHLRWGNSLIGSDVRTVEREIRMTDRGGQAMQLGLFAGPFAGLLDLTGLMIEVAEQADATLADVHHSAELFDQFQKELIPYKQVLDLWVSHYFGNAAAKEFLTLYGADVLPALRGQKQVSENYQAAIQQARDLWRDKHFFHWDLEFPEVFVDLRRRDWAENPGFDAVIGNPPWGADVSKFEQSYLRSSFDSTKATLDSFATLTERGIGVLNPHGYFGYIIPSGWQTGKSYAPFRKLILENTTLSRIVNLPYDVFPEAYVDTTILIAQKQKSLDGTSEVIAGTVGILTFERRENVVQIWENDPRFGYVNYNSWFSERLDPNKEFSFLSFLTGKQLGISVKVASCSVPIAELADIQRGITPFQLEDQKLGKNYELALDGELRRYRYEFSGKRFVKYDETIAEYKPPRYFKGPRVILRELISRQFRLQAVLVDKDFITNKSHQSILLKDPNYSLGYLLAVLNSKLLSHYHIRSSAIALRDDFPKIVLDETRNLPIYHVSFTTPADSRTRLAVEVQKLAEGLIASHQSLSRVVYTSSRLGAFIADRLSAAPEEQSDVVHDLLAHLAGQMIEMNKEKQAHLREFRLDLAGYLDEKQLAKLNRLYTPKKPPAEGIKAYEQKLKTYQQAVQLAQAQLGQLAGETLDLDDFWRLSQAQWMWLLRQNLGQVTNMSSLVSVYQQHHHQLAPLMRRLHRTDWLIDQVVYQLYGLTEEEIKVVEGE